MMSERLVRHLRFRFFLRFRALACSRRRLSRPTSVTPACFRGYKTGKAKSREHHTHSAVLYPNRRLTERMKVERAVPADSRPGFCKGKGVQLCGESEQNAEKVRAWPFSAHRAKSAVFALLHLSNSYVLERCAAPPCTALAGRRKEFSTAC